MHTPPHDKSTSPAPHNADPPPTPLASPAPPSAKSLRSSTMRSMGILLGSTVLTRGVAIVSQIALSWLLSENDFGIIGLVLSIKVIAEIAKDAGVRDVMIQCGDRWQRYYTPAFWLSGTAGLISLVLLLVAGAVAGWQLDERTVGFMLAIVALEAMFNAFSVVPAAALQRQMRFGTLASGDIVYNSGTFLLVVLCAVLGFGAYSFVIPLPFTAFARLMIYWSLARTGRPGPPSVKHWGVIFGQSWYLIASTGIYRLYAYGDYFILTLFATRKEVGHYYMAYTVAIQFVSLLSANLASVLLPAFASIKESPQRVRDGLTQAIRGCLSVGLPLLALQAICAPAAVKAVLAPKWEPSIPIIQILSLALGLRITSGIIHAYFKSAGAFSAYFVLVCISTSGGLLFVWGAASSGGGPVGVALAILAWGLLFDPFTLMWGYRKAGLPIHGLLTAYALPIANTTLALFPVWALDHWVLEPQALHAWLRLPLLGLTGLGMLWLTTPRLDPYAWKMGHELVLSKLRRRRAKAS
ncbi:MAG: oligosaccharide flippase family protein [Planctomycetota bacterium]